MRVAAPVVATSAAVVNGVSVNSNTSTIQAVAAPKAAAVVSSTYSVVSLI